jgi:hypothetical protein
MFMHPYTLQRLADEKIRSSLDEAEKNRMVSQKPNGKRAKIWLVPILLGFLSLLGVVFQVGERLL